MPCPRDVAGYDLLAPLGGFEKTIWQGINGPIWALIALDCGGWNLTAEGGSGEADADITGMALQALAKYQDQGAVKAAIERALACLSQMQSATGGFDSWGTANSESCAQVLVALGELGISPEDSRFVKNGNTVLDALLTFRQQDGSFRHTASGSGNDQMASEQGLYGIVSALRAMEGKSSLYRRTT